MSWYGSRRRQQNRSGHCARNTAKSAELDGHDLLTSVEDMNIPLRITYKIIIFSVV